MNLRNKILLYLKRVINRIQTENNIVMKAGSKVGKNWSVANSELFGVFDFGDNVSCNGSRLNGAVRVGDNVKIKDSVFGGKITLGEGTKIVGGVKLLGEIEIGKYCSLNGPNLDIQAAINKVSIGNFCSIARNVTFQEFNHDPNRLTTYFVMSNLNNGNRKQDVVSKGAITVGHDVWIGTHCVVLSGANIGTGAVIAANSVVTGDIPPYVIAAGTPAKVIKYRFEDKKIKELLESKWWDKNEEEILQLYKNFSS